MAEIQYSIMTTETQLALIEGTPEKDMTNDEDERRDAFEQNALESLPFSGAYEQLRDEGWDYVSAGFIAWKSLPKKARYPKSIKKLANLLGVSADAIKKRRQKNPLIDERANKALLTGSLLPRADKVIEALVGSASRADYHNHADRKLFLEMVGLYTPKQAIDVRGGLLEGQESEQSEDELRRVAAIGGGE